MELTNENLNNLKNKTDNQLKIAVVDYLLENHADHEERNSFIRDLLQHGCVSGMVTDLIYYKDSNAFSDKYEGEIWDLANEQMESFGETENILQFFANLNGSKDVGSMEQFKNLLAWYGFEEMTRIIYEQDFEIEF